MEKSPPSNGTGGITAGDLPAQSFIKAFSICPIPTCSSARDDGVGKQHPVISEGDDPHLRHFDRSVAKWRNLTPPMTKRRPALPSFRPEWRNLPPLMVHEALRQEISRLRVSSKRFPSAPYRHAAPLEMTVLASSIQSFQKGTNPIPVISTKALWSGEISLHQ